MGGWPFCEPGFMKVKGPELSVGIHPETSHWRQLKQVFYKKPRRGDILKPRASPWVRLSESAEPCKGVI